MKNFVGRFVRIRKQMEELGMPYPSLAAWYHVTEGEYETELEYHDDECARSVLRFGKYKLTFTAHYADGSITDITLWDGETPVFCSSS